jgi:hypothetical protein
MDTKQMLAKLDRIGQILTADFAADRRIASASLEIGTLIGLLKADALRDKTVFSELSRRRIWNGYRGDMLAESPADRDIVLLGRKWLTEIGQVPDWTLPLQDPALCSASSRSKSATAEVSSANT